MTSISERIVAGELDGELADILQALHQRNVERVVTTRWRVRLGDLVVTEDDVTLDELEMAERLARRSWQTLHPVQSAASAKALLVAAHVHRLGMSESDAKATVGKLTGGDVIDAVDTIEVPGRPFPRTPSPPG